MCAGVLVHAAAAVIGLSALLATSSVAFAIVKVIGAVFLVVLGVGTIWNARRATEKGSTEPESGSVPPTSIRVSWVRFGSSPFWQGFWSNVLNPKVALLFLSLLPQFVDAGEAVFLKTLVLSGTFLAMGCGCSPTWHSCLESRASFATIACVEGSSLSAAPCWSRWGSRSRLRTPNGQREPGPERCLRALNPLRIPAASAVSWLCSSCGWSFSGRRASTRSCSADSVLPCW